ncbi:hypothetical protein MTR_7g005850 [Medicago truncatula]|uniref:Uncharacterized protein n=1 Tax=Medicago truncatula TaxID=3880 RepID=G7KWN5_MEDTR|nr:hypothetical protein MTR_7g005850 [Medicago truncatula]
MKGKWQHTIIPTQPNTTAEKQAPCYSKAGRTGLPRKHQRGFHIHSKYKETGMCNLPMTHLQALTFTSSTIASTSKLTSLKTLSFLAFHKVQIVVSQITPNPHNRISNGEFRRETRVT